jgi:hypothetical protein
MIGGRLPRSCSPPGSPFPDGASKQVLEEQGAQQEGAQSPSEWIALRLEDRLVHEAKASAQAEPGSNPCKSTSHVGSFPPLRSSVCSSSGAPRTLPRPDLSSAVVPSARAGRFR